MAHQVVLGYSSDSSEYVDVEGGISPALSGARNNSTRGPSISSDSVDWPSSIFGPSVSSDAVSVDMGSSISTAYSQCRDKDTLVECLSCSSYFELDTFCPSC
jgi:hypothetical protein